MLISKYICLFTLYSVIGWIYETIYITVTTGKWENRGFLYGPACPIYGTGALAIILLVAHTESLGIQMLPWQVFAVSVIGSAILEYLTSWSLEKAFHAVWWDYYDFPFNVHGRISLFTSLGFGGAGLLVVYGLAPFTATVLAHLTPLLAECLALVIVFLFAADLALTVSVLCNFDKMVIRMEESLNQNMDMLVNGAVNQTHRIKHVIVNKKNRVEEQMSSLSEFAKTTIRRAYYFRDNNIIIETYKNQILSIIKKAMDKSDASEIAKEAEDNSDEIDALE